jgi:hypothetical protein
LVATIGLPQVKAENVFDLPLVTAGNEAAHVAKFLQPGRNSYTAAEVIRLLLGRTPPVVPPVAEAQADLVCAASSSAG